MTTVPTELRKTCIVCKKTKTLCEYGFHSRNKKHKNECKECARAKAALYRIENREEYLKTAINSKLKSNYGFSLSEYERLFKEQNGKCAICNSNSPKQKNIKRFAVDHCHLTHEVRGLLCGNCNKGIGLFNDDIELLKAAISYLGGGF